MRAYAYRRQSIARATSEVETAAKRVRDIFSLEAHPVHCACYVRICEPSCSCSCPRERAVVSSQQNLLLGLGLQDVAGCTGQEWYEELRVVAVAARAVDSLKTCVV